MIRKDITYCCRPAVLACDGRCRKAWGINHRPRRYLSGDPDEPGIDIDEHCRRADDHVFLGDGELDDAPEDPGTYEGGHGKPSEDDGPDRLNKWCARECERSYLGPGPVELPDMEHPAPNVPRGTP